VDVAQLYSRLYKWVTVMDGVKFEFNDIIYHCIRKTILSENGQSAYGITKYNYLIGDRRY